MDDKNFTKIKELLETANDKLRKVELMQNVSTEQIRSIKEQQSVMNKKLDTLEENQGEMQETLETHTVSLINIETTLEGYATMYDLNEDHIGRLQKRLKKVEKNLDIDVEEELLVPTRNN